MVICGCRAAHISAIINGRGDEMYFSLPSQQFASVFGPAYALSFIRVLNLHYTRVWILPIRWKTLTWFADWFLIFQNHSPKKKNRSRKWPAGCWWVDSSPKQYCECSKNYSIFLLIDEFKILINSKFVAVEERNCLKCLRNLLNGFYCCSWNSY